MKALLAAGELHEAQVLEHRQRRHEAEVLVHEGHAEPAVVAGLERQGDGFAVEAHLATLVGRVEAGEDLDERRLAGAVLAEKPVNLSRHHVEAHVAQRAGAAEGL